MNRFGTVVCIFLAAAIAVAVAQSTRSVNMVWRNNPECLGPPTGSAEWDLLDNVSGDNGTCTGYNSTYNILYTYISAVDDNSTTCNATGENTYLLHLDSECQDNGVPAVYYTSCSRWIPAGGEPTQPIGVPVAQPIGVPVAQPIGVPVAQPGEVPTVPIVLPPTFTAPTDAPSVLPPLPTIPEVIPAATAGAKRQQEPTAQEGEASGSQQFACDGSTFEMAPYVQIHGPGCSNGTETPNLQTWTVTWSNAAGCNAVYNYSAANIGLDGGIQVSYAMVEEVCQPGATNYTVTLYSDSGCTQQTGTFTFDDGCTDLFNATCYTNSTITPETTPLVQEPSITIPPAGIEPSSPIATNPELRPEFEPLIVEPFDEPSGAATLSASAVLLSAVAVLAYLL